MEKPNDTSAENPVDAQGIRVFVYGTLKRGHGNHSHYLKNNPDVAYLGRCGIEGAYAMYGGGFFPWVVKTKDKQPNKIYGEVYRVSRDVLDVLDVLEGHPNWYRREKVSTPWKGAWVYFMPEKDFLGKEHLIESGMWNPLPHEVEWLQAHAGHK